MNPQTKKSNRKTFLIFLGIIALSAVLGFFMGMGMGSLAGSDAFATWKEQSTALLAVITPVLYVLLNAVCFTAAIVFYCLAKKRAAAWDGEDEELIDRVESELSLPQESRHVPFQSPRCVF